jgi:hypothetical protein
MFETEVRRLARTRHVEQRLHEFHVGGKAAIDAAFHAAAEKKIGRRVAERVLREVRGRTSRRRFTTPPTAAIRRPVDAEHRLLLVDQADDAVQPGPRLRAARHRRVDDQQNGECDDAG